ncbi:MAG TPA: signaling protein, partial [Sphingomonas sp.]|nr:signaling protein [Sphingomonas sp.]
EYLALPDPAAPPAGAPGAAPATSTPAATPSAPAAPPPQAAANLLQRLQAEPTDGGYRIGAGGLPGIQPGDVVQSVNGQALGKGAADQAAFAAAQASGSAQIQVLRDGKPMTLTVPLR